MKEEASSTNLTSFTFSSSAMMDTYISGRALPCTYMEATGWRFLIFAALRALRPSTTISSTAAMLASSSGSMKLSSFFGQSQRCMLSGALLSTVRTIF